MAKDLYGHRQMYQSPLVFIILIPIGAILLIFLADKCFDLYYNHKTKEDTQMVLEEMLTLDSLKTHEDYVEYAKKRFKELDYDTDVINVEFIDDYIMLFVNKSYFSVIGEIVSGTTKTAEAKYKGKYNEYKEVVIEEYTQEDEEKYFDTEDDTEYIEPEQ